MNNNIVSRRNNSIGNKVVLFLISPLLSLIYSLQSLDSKSSRVVIFLFCIFFGLAFTVSDIRTDGSPDGITYRLLFQDYSNISTKEYMQSVQEFFTFSGTVKDIYADTLAYLVSRITYNYHIFFMVIAAIFSLFQLKCLQYFTSNRNYFPCVACYLLVFLFTFVSIKNINGLRFWTAYWITLYILFKLILDNKHIYVIGIALLPLVHGSYIVIWLLFSLYYLTSKYRRIWSILLVLSLLFGNLSLSLIQDNTTYIPIFLSRYVDYYASDEIVARINAAGSGFYLLDRIFPVVVNIYLNIMLFMINRERKHIEQLETNHLLSFTIIIVSFANFVMPVPSLGKRFMILSYPLIAYLWLDLFGLYYYRRFLYLLPVVFFMSIYHLFESYVNNVDLLFYISSPIVDLIRFI